MIKIRYAKAEDAAVWIDVYFETWRTTYGDIFNEEVFLAREKNRDERIERLKNNIRSDDNNKSLCHAVATDHDKVVGIIVYGKAEKSNDIIDDTYCEVYSIYILKEYQRLGIGTQLIDFAKRDLDKDGYNKLVIWSLNDNPSINFYSKIRGKVFLEKTKEIYGKTLKKIGFVFDI